MIAEEPEHHHGHKTGIPWLDLIIAGSAILISVVSLMVSIHHGKVMESLVHANTRMVEASTLPILNFGSGNADENGQPVVALILTNVGVGPATIDWMDMAWNGKPITGMRAFLNDCCSAGSGGWFASGAAGRVLPPGEVVPLLTVPKANQQAASWDRLDAARTEVTARACYCSVLEQCWVTDFKHARPQPVKTCAAARAGDFSPPAKEEH